MTAGIDKRVRRKHIMCDNVGSLSARMQRCTVKASHKNLDIVCRQQHNCPMGRGGSGNG